ncbi:MAG: beta-ketoacyl synthase chain length factor [Burkholderiales bacterium]|nr:beta-ketoacyl synthase chain length factor [Burkholderiales bacterium]
MTSGATLAVGIAGIGLLGPGFSDWDSGRLLLLNPGAWQRAPTLVPAPSRLPATERRRAGLIVKASVGVADQACAMAGIDPATLATVFTSSTGDPANCHALCETLATPQRLMSPTRFTNSVHNASAGYWHIAVRSMQPSTSLAGYDASVGAGLLEAASQCVATQRPILLVACDLPYPEPLHALRPVADVFAFALLLRPSADDATMRLKLSLGSDDRPATRCADAALEALRRAIPAARALPLLQALANGAAGDWVLDDQPGLTLRLSTLR